MVEVIDLTELFEFSIKSKSDPFIESADLEILLGATHRTTELGGLTHLILWLFLKLSVFGDLNILNLEQVLDGSCDFGTGASEDGDDLLHKLVRVMLFSQG